MEELDVWRSAGVLIQYHGVRAEHFAMSRVQDMMSKGDSQGEMIWRRILQSIQDLQRNPTKPGEGAAVRCD
jgi:hypothetical protein